jgi:hypothetical protein
LPERALAFSNQALAAVQQAQAEEHPDTPLHHHHGLVYDNDSVLEQLPIENEAEDLV